MLTVLARALACAALVHTCLAETTKEPTIRSSDGNVLFDAPGGFCFGVPGKPAGFAEYKGDKGDVGATGQNGTQGKVGRDGRETASLATPTASSLASSSAPSRRGAFRRKETPRQTLWARRVRWRIASSKQWARASTSSTTRTWKGHTACFTAS